MQNINDLARKTHLSKIGSDPTLIIKNNLFFQLSIFKKYIDCYVNISFFAKIELNCLIFCLIGHFLIALSLKYFYNLYITGEEESQKEKLHYTNPRVCKSFLLKCCPHEILAQTVRLRKYLLN